jgi:DNA sulfur modification protein DndC
MTEQRARKKSYFEELGFSQTIALLTAEIRALYLSDDTPWVIGYSGGKDSTAVAQLAWLALASLSKERRPQKPIYVITTDTLVENPVVAAWVNSSLEALRGAAERNALPFQAMLLPPETPDTFWVNLIGKGYPAPRPGFRWCTERLKIKPSSRFIESTANKHGEAILLLGTRRAESSVRSASIDRREILTKEGLTAHSELVSTLVYSPIQDWSNEDVWLFLNRISNPWGQSNKDLMALYRGATEDNECPIVVDTSTPSCGNSRFGCWVCTLVDQDKSMKAMIQNDTDKSWMQPLLEIRNELDFRGDLQRERDIARREFRRLRGTPTLNRTGDALVPGPYTQEARVNWLTRLLEAQTSIRRNPAAPAHVRNIELITRDELEYIRRVWVEEKHEIEDLLPTIFKSVTGEDYVHSQERSPVLDAPALSLLKAAAGGDRLHYETLRNLLHIESQHRRSGTTIAKRGLFKELEVAIGSGFFTDHADALSWAKTHTRPQEAMNPYSVDPGDVRLIMRPTLDVAEQESLTDVL